MKRDKNKGHQKPMRTNALSETYFTNLFETSTEEKDKHIHTTLKSKQDKETQPQHNKNQGKTQQQNTNNQPQTTTQTNNKGNTPRTHQKKWKRFRRHPPKSTPNNEKPWKTHPKPMKTRPKNTKTIQQSQKRTKNRLQI